MSPMSHQRFTGNPLPLVSGVPRWDSSGTLAGGQAEVGEDLDHGARMFDSYPELSETPRTRMFDSSRAPQYDAF